jgi:hypothetical protein
LLDILRKKIADDRFINLIRKFLSAGYLENWAYQGVIALFPNRCQDHVSWAHHGYPRCVYVNRVDQRGYLW